MSIRKLKVTPFLVSHLLKRCDAYESDLPEDVQAREIYWEPKQYCYFLLLESAAFEPLQEGEQIPEITATFTKVPIPLPAPLELKKPVS